MNGISHKQAQRYLRMDLDGLLSEAQRLDLETHLRACAACRIDSESFSRLTTRLQAEFHSRRDLRQDGPSQSVLTNIHAKSRRIMMQKRIDFAFNIFGAMLTLLVLFFVVTSVISQFQKKSTTANGTQTSLAASEPKEERLLAFMSQQEGNFEIYTVRADGSELTNLTNNSARDMNPVWSPDGKRIAFLSDDRSGSGILQIYSMNPDGTNLVRLTNIPDTEWWAGMDWSPDGQYLVAQHFPMEAEQTTPGKGHVNIYLINANGSGATQLTENESGGDHSAQWSPKGDLIAFLHTESNLTQIYTIHPDGTGLFKLSNSERNDSAFNWSPDGTRINYISSPIHCSPPDHCPRNEIWSMRADGTEGMTLLAFPAPDVTLDQIDWIPDRITWSPDGTRLVSVTWDSSPGSAGNSYLSILSPFNNADAVQKKIPGHIAQAYWSPDGLFFTYSSDVSGNWDIYTLRVTDVLQNPDAEPLQITSSPAADTSPAWQPIP
jgi:TolB protein